MRCDAERAVEAGDDAQSPEEPLPEDLVDRLATPDATKRKLDVNGDDGGDGGDGEGEEDVPQTFERRRKKSKSVGTGIGSGGSLASSDQQPSEKENAKDASNVDAQTTQTTQAMQMTRMTAAPAAAVASTSAMRAMTKTDFGPSIAGKGLVVYWPGKYSDWFAATVLRFDEKRKKMVVRYDADGYKDTMDLRKVMGLIDKGWIKVCERGSHRHRH